MWPKKSCSDLDLWPKTTTVRADHPWVRVDMFVSYGVGRNGRRVERKTPRKNGHFFAFWRDVDVKRNRKWSICSVFDLSTMTGCVYTLPETTDGDRRAHISWRVNSEPFLLHYLLYLPGPPLLLCLETNAPRTCCLDTTNQAKQQVILTPGSLKHGDACTPKMPHEQPVAFPMEDEKNCPRLVFSTNVCSRKSL